MVNLNFSIARNDSGNFVIISSQNIMLEEEVLDATTNHDSRIALAFQKGLSNFQVTPKYKYLNEKFIQRVNNPDSIIYKTQKFTKGIFKTPQDLAFNTIDTATLYFKHLDFVRTKAYVRDELNNKEIQNIFAFSNGESIFLNSLHYGHQHTNSKLGYMFDKVPLSGCT